MKPAYRFSLLLSTATLALCAAHAALASGAPDSLSRAADTLPSIEIHLDVLSSLNQPQPTMVPATTAAPAPAVSNFESPFGKPSSPLPKSAAVSKPAPKPTHITATVTTHPSKKLASETKPAPKPTVVASMDANPPLAAELPQSSEAPSDDIPKPEMKALPSEATMPPLPIQSEAATPVPPAPPVPAVVPDAPKLMEAAASLSTPAAAPKQESSGGFADLLSGDSDSKPTPPAPQAEVAPLPPPPAATAAAQPAPPAPPVVAKTPAPEPVVAALPEPVKLPTPPTAPKVSIGELSAPPSDLTAAAPSPSAHGRGSDERDLPPAPPGLAESNSPADNPPPLTPAIQNSDSGKMVMAANDMPALATKAPSEESAKSELPALPAPPAEQQMAQTTLTPIPSLPPSSAGATATPAAPPVAAAPPAVPALQPAAAVPPPAPAAVTSPSASNTPSTAAVPEGTPAGTPPDMRVVFNESETDVPLGSTGKLDALAQRLTQHANERVTIMAYASGPETTGIYPKRVSLARGIAVRNYLTSSKGIDIERVNVKALGNKNEGGGPGDRVDIFILK